MGGLRVFAVAVMLVALLPISAATTEAPLGEGDEIALDAEQVSYDQKNNAIDARGAPRKI